jgi:hypothetical protein
MNLVRCQRIKREIDMTRYLLHLHANEPDHPRISDDSEREDGIILCERRSSVQCKCTVEYQHTLCNRHEHPAKVDFDVEAAVALALCVQFRDGDECACGEVFVKDAHEDDGKGREEGVE